VERDFEPTGGTGGGGSVCEPNTSEACYSGPAGTEDMGVCQQGTHVCLEDGSGYGPCEGEVVPSAENCATVEDESCSGDETAECPSLGHLWSKGFLITNELQPRGIAVDPATNDIIITGSLSGVIDLGGGPLASTGSTDMLLARYTADGEHVWSRRFGDSSSQDGNAVVIDGDGMIYVTGEVTGSIDLGDGNPLTSAGSDDVLLAKFDPAGNVVWGKLFGDAMGTQRGQQIALTKSGQIVVGGTFSSTLNLGGSDLVATNTDVFVARFDGSGFHAMSRRFAGPNYEKLGGLVVDGQDNIVITGSFDSGIDFLGAGVLASAGQYDVFVAKLQGQTASPIWARSWGDATDQEGLGVAVTPADEIVMTGEMKGAIDFGDAGAIAAQGSATNVYMAKLAADGAPVWAKVFGGAMSGSDWGMFTKVANDRILTAGWFSDQIDFGGGPIAAQAQVSPFVAQLSLDGAHLHSRTFNAMAPAGVLALGALPAGDAIIAGLSYGTIDLDGAILQSDEPNKIILFLARLLP